LHSFCAGEGKGDRLLNYVLRRFANFLLLVFLASSLGFLLASTALDPRANYLGSNPPISESTIAQKLDQINANPDTPIYERYITWGSGVLKGDFGLTIAEQEIRPLFGEKIWVSLRLLLIGSVLGSVIGVFIGVISAVRQYKLFDRFTGISSFVLLSTPVFLLAITIKFIAIYINQKIGTTLFYTVGEYSPDFQGSTFSLFVNRLQHLILPTLAVTLGGIAFYSRYQRNSMLDVLSSDHLRTARAKGLTKREALFKHGLRLAILPMSTLFAYSFGLLITGAAFTETIFGWYGMGSWFILAIGQNDANVVSAIVLFSAVLVLFSGFLADVVSAALDPRVRLQGK
jgi:peptide/nickel transport system permease protein